METPNIMIPTPATEWKGKINPNGTPLELPSGNVALVQYLSPVAFLSSGLIPDPLRPIIQKAIHDKRGLPPKIVKKMMDDSNLLASAMELMDRTICYVVIQPEIFMPPACDFELDEEEFCGQYANTPAHKEGQPSFKHKYHEGVRDQNILYADQVQMPDKEFIFQAVIGGTKQLESFREQRSKSVGSVLHG